MPSHVDAVFVVSPGRSGTDYLASLFSVIPQCAAFHEPEPVCNARAMQNYLAGDDAHMRQLTELKRDQIRAACDAGKVYVETNHCFIKGFGWLLPDMLPDLNFGIITLRRPTRNIADSYLRLNIRPLSKDGQMWLMTPKLAMRPGVRCPGGSMSRSLFRTLEITSRTMQRLGVQPHWQDGLDHRYLRWGTLETRAWAKAYRERYPHFAYHSTTLSRINTPAGVRTMLQALGLPWHADIDAHLGVPRNLKRSTPRRAA